MIIQIGNINSFNPSTVEPINVPNSNTENNPDPTTPDNPIDPGTDPTPQGGGDDPGTNPGTDPTPSGDMTVRIKLVNGRGDTVRMERLIFYITPLYNVTDCYANANDTIHSGIEINNINVTL